MIGTSVMKKLNNQVIVKNIMPVMNIFNQMFQRTSSPSAVREHFDANVLGKLNIEYCLVISITLQKKMTFFHLFRE